MKAQVKALYELFEKNKDIFLDRGLPSEFFIDIFRGQIHDSQLFDFYPLPAIFIEYSMTGEGKKNPRTVNMILHIALDNSIDTDNINGALDEGLINYLTCLTIQELLEDSKLGQTSRLKFINESPVDAEVLNYHLQTYEFTAYVQDMIGNYPEKITGTIEEIILNES